MIMFSFLTLTSNLFTMIYNKAMVLKYDLLDTKILYSVYEYSIFCNDELLSKIIIKKILCNIKMHESTHNLIIYSVS